MAIDEYVNIDMQLTSVDGDMGWTKIEDLISELESVCERRGFITRKVSKERKYKFGTEDTDLIKKSEMNI